MARTFGLLVTLFILYLTLQVSFKFFSKGHEVKYVIKKEEQILKLEEKFVNNGKKSNYLIKAEIDSSIFYFQTYLDFGKAETIVKDYAYKDFGDYKCMLLIAYGKKNITDITCYDGYISNNYNDIEGQKKELDDWVNGLGGYERFRFRDNELDELEGHLVKISKKNVLENHYFTIENYSGVHTINRSNSNLIVDAKLFQNDQYKREIAGYAGKYYITLDYSQQFEFNSFLVMDITTNEKFTINSNFDINNNSYVMGSHEDSLFIFDKVSKKQFQINAKTKKVIEVGNQEDGIKIYENGKPKRIEFVNFDQKMKFNQKQTQTNDYIKIDEILGKNGITYFYKEEKGIYNVFSAPTEKKDFKTFVFQTTDLNSVIYLDDVVYYKENDKIKYYSIKTGSRTLYENSELKFNSSIKFGVYGG